MKNLFFILALVGFSQIGMAQKKAPSKSATQKSAVKQGSAPHSKKMIVSESQLIGKWQLVEYKHGAPSKKPKTLTSCDTLLRWEIYKDSVSKKLQVQCKTSENCEDFGFQSECVLNKSNLMIKKTKIMGFGGVSASGSFVIKQLTPEKMVLGFQKSTYTFKKD